MQTDFDNDLLSYFTDVEHLRNAFKEYVASPKLPKRLIVIHGVGGVGKSSLLRMFRLFCKSEKIPVALASGDDAKSVFDVLTRWTEDLKGDGSKFSALGKTLESYRAIQAKVEGQAKKSQNKVADIASKAASKTAETAGGALLGAAIGSVIPGVGTAIGGALGGVVGGMGAEALTDWLRGFLSKPDIDLLLDPAKRLSADFLDDITKIAEKKRVVLLLDTFEHLSALEDWVGEVAQKIHLNVLLVIAGRKLPDWNLWSGWMMNAQVEELKPMTEDVMRELIRRYYATMRGGEPDSVQVDAIIKFARGLPMVVTSAVQLWVKYGVEDFQSVKAEIVANLVDRLIEGVPSSLIPALEAAAVVRWFDQPIMRAVTKQEDVRDVYSELRRFPFVRSRAEGLALHDSVREMMDENLRVQDSERYVELHERAAAYFEKRLEKATGEEAERFGLERLYHRVCEDEETGIKLFQEIADSLAHYRLINRLQILLHDASFYCMQSKHFHLWVRYYNARVDQITTAIQKAEDELNQIILASNNTDAKLISYALCDLGEIHSSWIYLGKLGEMEKAEDYLNRSLSLAPLDAHLVGGLIVLARINRIRGNLDAAVEYFNKAIEFFKKGDDNYGLVYAYSMLRDFYAGRGDWQKTLCAYEDANKYLQTIGKDSYSRERLLGWAAWAWVLFGRYSECEHNLREALRIGKARNSLSSAATLYRYLGSSLGYQNRFSEALEYFDQGERIIQSLGWNQEVNLSYYQARRGVCLFRSGDLENSISYLISCLHIREHYKITPDIPEVVVWLGQIYEMRNDWENARKQYESCLKLIAAGRLNFHCEALVGLIRVKYVQRDVAAIPPLLEEAEQLAQQYEYNDHLASLRLTQGHLAWESGSRDEAFDFYQKAMIYALRYNRFLLDELLSGRPQGTPLRPIIPYCLERGENGKEILIAMRDWWKSESNDVGSPRPDTISPIPEGIPLLEAEKIAREREPGNGSAQKSVIEQIEAAIGE